MKVMKNTSPGILYLHLNGNVPGWFWIFCYVFLKFSDVLQRGTYTGEDMYPVHVHFYKLRKKRKFPKVYYNLLMHSNCSYNCFFYSPLVVEHEFSRHD